MRQEIVVITGASAGMGRATAIEFARHGWPVALLARDAGVVVQVGSALA